MRFVIGVVVLGLALKCLIEWSNVILSGNRNNRSLILGSLLNCSIAKSWAAALISSSTSGTKAGSAEAVWVLVNLRQHNIHKRVFLGRLSHLRPGIASAKVTCFAFRASRPSFIFSSFFPIIHITTVIPMAAKPDTKWLSGV